ncbi:MAG: putative Ig domain-containing protein [Opitutales bacterium]
MQSLSPRLFLLLLTPLAGFAENLNTIVIGNSFTAQVRWGTQGYQSLVNDANHGGIVDETTIPGVALSQHWPQEKYVDAFRNTTWDAISLQTWAGYDTELPNARRLAEAAWGLRPVGPNAQPGDPLGISPDAKLYIYAHTRFKVAAFDDGRFLMDRTAVANEDEAALDYHLDMVEQLRSDYPTKEIYLVPASVAMYEIDKYMEAGLIPGFDDYADLTRDATGHANDIGSYALALCFFATFFGEDPTGLPVPPEYPVDATTAAIFQEIVWRTVSRYPMSGVPDSMVVSTWHLPRGLVDTAYTAQFETYLEQGSVSWSLASGNLPAGLTLQSNGSLTGTPTENGTFLFEVTATDGAGQSDTRKMLLAVDSDNPPAIDTTALSPATRGAPYSFSLQASGGVPGYRWSVKKGIIPHGLTVSENGIVSGTTYSEPGDYDVTFVVEDSNPSAPVAVEQTYTFTVDPAENGTWFLGETSESALTLDGLLDEGVWDLEATANFPKLGASNNDVSFGVLRTADALHIGVRVVDASVTTDSADLVQDDCVQIFLDALHDREATFNADDRHLVIDASGRFEERNARPTGITVATSLTADGYSVEVRVPWSNLGIQPEDYFSVGFDLGVSDDDNGGDREGYSVWLSASDLDTAPSQFGNLCFWPILETNFLQNPGFESGGLNAKNFSNQNLVVADADDGWKVTTVWLASFMRLESNPGDGFPNKGSIAYGTSNIDGALFQLLNDNRATKGQGYLIFDVRDPHPAMEFGIWGFQGGAATVDSKLGPSVREHPINPGSPDATLVQGALPVDGAPEGWFRFVIPFDAGAGYDYLLVGFSMEDNTGSPSMRIDNITCGAASKSELLYTPAVVTQAPFDSHSVPGRIEAEDYDTGGQGAAYFDTTPGNASNDFRLDDVDIEATLDVGGGFNISWTADGEWLEYTIGEVPAGTYDIRLRTTSNVSGGLAKSIAVSLDGAPLGTVTPNFTGSWQQNWETLTLSGVTLAGGSNQLLRLDIGGGNFNLNWIEFVEVNDDPPAPSPATYSDDFSDNYLGDWTAVAGDFWTAANGAVEYPRNDGPESQILTYNEAGSMSNYELTFDMASPDDDPMGAVFYFQDAENYLGVFATQGADQGPRWLLFKVENGVRTELDSVAQGYVANQVYTVTIVVQTGGNIDVISEGGTIALSAPTPGGFTGGTFGFYTLWNQGATFDNVSVAPLFDGYIEAENYENTTGFSPLEVKTDSTASGGAYIEVAVGNNRTSQPPASGFAEYGFFLESASMVEVHLRVIAVNGSGDSFWVQIDDTDWIRFNSIQATSVWEWDQVHDNAMSNALVTWDLAAGSHTLRIAYREDHTQLDRIFISADGSQPE